MNRKKENKQENDRGKKEGGKDRKGHSNKIGKKEIHLLLFSYFKQVICIWLYVYVYM